MDMLPTTRCFLVVLLAILGMTACEQSPTPPDDQPQFGSLSGLVLDQEAGLPIFGAVVLAMQNQVADTTGSRGYFQLDSLNHGEDTLKVTAPGYPIQYEAVEVAADTQQVILTLPKEAQSDYYLYVGNVEGTEVFIIDTENNVVIDTIQGFPYRVWHLAASFGANKLYVTTRNASMGRLFSVDLDTGEIKPIRDGIHEVFISPNETVFVITYDGFSEATATGYVGIINPLSDMITYFDTLEFRYDWDRQDQTVAFDPQQAVFYSFNSSGQLFAYDYLQRETIRTYPHD